MTNYAEGITCTGEHLRFERWVYEMYRCGEMTDPYLLMHLNRCIQFTILY